MERIFRPAGAVQWSWITLIGPDAQDFLHRLTTANIRAMQTGQGAKGCFLNPQGKIRSYFTLWNYRSTEYAFEFDAGADGKWKHELLTTIDQYTFAEKQTLADPGPELEACWIFLEPGRDFSHAPELRANETQAIDEEIRICHHGDADFGRPWITAWGRPQQLAQWIDRSIQKSQPISFDEIEQWRIQALRPRVGLEITDAVNPLEIGLTDAVAINKGCYPGQEVIEKISALGSPAKRLARIDGEGQAPKPGEKIMNVAEPPTEVGEVTSSIQVGKQFSALGMIRKIHAKEGLQVQFDQGISASIVRVAPYA